MFWNEFHSNFYASVNFNSKKSKVVKMQYVDWEEIKGNNDPGFNKVIKVCELFSLTDIMSFRYNWNEEVLAYFHATFFFSSLFGALCQRRRKLEGSTTFSMPWRLLQLVMFVSV